LAFTVLFYHIPRGGRRRNRGRKGVRYPSIQNSLISHIVERGLLNSTLMVKYNREGVSV
jgi:hypothetical protein